MTAHDAPIEVTWRGRQILHCHLVADTPAELHAAATEIGLLRSWYQSASCPHYDLLHSVVCYDGEMVHDPRPAGGGVLSEHDWCIIYALDLVSTSRLGVMETTEGGDEMSECPYERKGEGIEECWCEALGGSGAAIIGLDCKPCPDVYEVCYQYQRARAEAAEKVMRQLAARLRMAVDVLSQPMSASALDETRTYSSIGVGVVIRMMQDDLAAAKAVLGEEVEGRELIAMAKRCQESGSCSP